MRVQNTSATLSTNQIQNWGQSRLGHPRFPALWAICLFLLWASSHRLLVALSFAMIGCFEYFGFVVEHPTKCAPTEHSIPYDIIGYKRKRKQVSRNVMSLTADRVTTSASKTSLTFMALARRLFRSFLVFSFFLRGSWSVYYFISEHNSTKGKIISICEGQ